VAVRYPPAAPGRPALGYVVRPEHPPERLPELALRVEAAGFDELWLWEDCFFAGGFAATATALAATTEIRVGLGIAPAPVRNPVFLAMEIAALARLYPGRLLPGVGHGVAGWMRQVGAKPASQLALLEETVSAVRALLAGETVHVDGRYVRLDGVRLDHPPEQAPPVSTGVRRAKSLALSGRVADGTILSEPSAVPYVEWAREQIATGPKPHRLTVYAWNAVDRDPAAGRATLRPLLAERLVDGGPQVEQLGIAGEVQAMLAEGGPERLREAMPDDWIDRLAVVGDPDTCAAAIHAFARAGVDAIVLVPPTPHADDIDALGRDLLPLV
jgi:alkanesulfonate monooxygenase SsuD/methylene tetrahydromethanopterin reductase-like flavin-dependent oxidoreductase (luciferase family)